MTEWFSPQVGPWFSLLSLLSVYSGTAPWIARGEHKTLVTRLYFGAIALGGLFLGASLLAWLQDQPAHVVGPLLLSGFVVTVVFVAVMPVVFKGYADAEGRKMLAKDL